jgi:sugar phosphate isomerase/epimerase
MNRRTFVQALGSALASGPLPAFPNRYGHLNRIGLELFSVRDAMHRDPERTLAAVAAAGYKDVELLWSFGNFGRTPAQVRATLDKEGLRAPSAHVSPEVLLVGWERSLAIAHHRAELQCRHLTLAR